MPYRQCICSLRGITRINRLLLLTAFRNLSSLESFFTERSSRLICSAKWKMGDDGVAPSKLKSINLHIPNCTTFHMLFFLILFLEFHIFCTIFEPRYQTHHIIFLFVYTENPFLTIL